VCVTVSFFSLSLSFLWNLGGGGGGTHRTLKTTLLKKEKEEEMEGFSPEEREGFRAERDIHFRGKERPEEKERGKEGEIAGEEVN